MGLDLTVEQWKILHAPKKDKDKTAGTSLLKFGAQPDSIPPVEFPRVEYTQKKVDEL